MNEKQQQLTFDKGITNVPSDALCSDNALEDCVGLVYDNGEHRVVQKPKTVLTGVQGTLLYIHKTSVGDRYILRNGYNIVWRINSGGQLTGGDNLLVESNDLHVLQITSIGKTLILSTDKGVIYYLTKQTSYQKLEDIPEPDVDFLLTDFRDNAGYDSTPTTVELGEVFDGGAGWKFHTPYDQNQKVWNDFVIGQYSRNKKMAAKAYRFVNPFFIRVAVEMYDGTYAKISAPILMVPTLRWNSEMSWKNSSGNDAALIRTWSCALKYKLNNSYEAYSDLVKGVVVFVSDEIETQKTDSDIPELFYFRPAENNTPAPYDGDLLTISENENFQNLNARFVAPQEKVRITPPLQPEVFINRDICHYNIDGYDYDYYPVPLPRSEEDIMKDLKDVSIFYKIAELGRTPNDNWENIKKVAKSGGLENLTTMTSLNADNSSDYYDHAKPAGNFAFVYNDRLNLADIKRSFFAGFKSFMCYDINLDYSPNIDPAYEIAREDSSGSSYYKAVVTINTDQIDNVKIIQEYSTTQKQGLWFYYPDTRAKHVKIYKKEGSVWYLICDANLTEHSGLNGAYYLQDLPFSAGYIESGNSETPPSTNNNNDFEELGNYIIASEVNNPFVFKAEGYVQVGVGKVKAVSTITKAISQGQFGGFPLVAFSDNGIWALSISNTGIISTAKPMEREVVNDNVQGITQSDDAVFFASQRSKLMAVVGSGSGVTVQGISEQLCGKQATGQDLMTFLNSAVIAYDYRDSLLWIFDTSTHGTGQAAVVGSQYCWIYSIKSGTFARYDFGNAIRVTNVVNNYPDYLLQAGGKVYSLLERPDINQDGNTVGGTFVPNTYSAHLITRPMKLENALALKSIMQIRHISQMDGTMTLRIFASNNLDNWAELHSLRGMPWKYYKFQYDFEHLTATDRFAGTMLITQERRINKLR